MDKASATKAFYGGILAFVVILCGALGLTTRHPAPASPAALSAAASVGRAPLSPPFLGLRRNRPKDAFIGPMVTVVDGRTPDQLTQAACAGANGWRCKSKKAMTFGAAAGGGTQAQLSWTIPHWFIDGANTTTCASDSNNCTVGTCGAAGIGPCLSYAELVRRWGTSAPTLAQQTTFTFLSDDNESFEIVPRILGNLSNSAVNVTGTLHQVATGTLGAVTAKNRPTNQLLNVNLGQSPTTSCSGGTCVGALLTDTTRGASAWIDSIVSGNVVVLTQPLPVPTAGASGLCNQSAVAPETDNFTSGDAYTISVPSKMGATRIDPDCMNLATNFLGCTCVQNIWVTDPQGPSQSMFNVGIQVDIEQSRVDPNLAWRTPRMNQEPAAAYNVWMNGAMQNSIESQNSPQLFGGAVYTSNAQGAGVASNGQFILDGDIIVHGFLLTVGALIGSAYFDHHYDMGKLTYIAPNIGDAAIWGTGLLTLDSQTQLTYPPGGSFQSVFMDTGGFQFGRSTSITTGCALDTSGDPAIWHCGIPLTAVNMDKSIASGGFGGAAMDPFLAISISREQ